MTMQNTPLLMSRILGRGAIMDPEIEVVTQQADGTHRQTLKQTWNRANQVAHALNNHGIGISDRVGSFMWNNYRHLELYQGVPSMGAVLHTLNIRLSPVDLEYIINHAGDRVIFADEDLLPLLEPLWGKIPCVELLVICRHGEGAESSFESQIEYEDFIKDQPIDYDWPEIDENSPMGLCYTSGTTGKPKGVLGCCMNVGVANAEAFLQARPMNDLVPVVKAPEMEPQSSSPVMPSKSQTSWISTSFCAKSFMTFSTNSSPLAGTSTAMRNSFKENVVAIKAERKQQQTEASRSKQKQTEASRSEQKQTQANTSKQHQHRSQQKQVNTNRSKQTHKCTC